MAAKKKTKRIVEVRATRTFNTYSVGDVVRMAETRTVKALIKNGLFELLKTETADDKPVDDAPHAEEPAADTVASDGGDS